MAPSSRSDCFPSSSSPPNSRWRGRRVISFARAPDLGPLDVSEALEPMRDLLVGHQVRLREVSDVGDPQVRAALDVDVLVVLDSASDAALDCMPFAVPAPRGVLAALIHWTVFYSSAVLAPWIADSTSDSVIRTCALAGLALHPGAVVPPLGYLIAAHRERFPELSSSPPDASS